MRSEKSALRRMDNVGVVVESLDEAITFVTELGLTLEGRAMIEGEWAGRVTGLDDQRVEIAMMVTPDGHSRVELSRFLAPAVVADHRNDPVNALGYLRVMFNVDDIDAALDRLRKCGAELVGEVARTPSWPGPGQGAVQRPAGRALHRQWRPGASGSG